MKTAERPAGRPGAAGSASSLHEGALRALSGGDLETARRLVEDGLRLARTVPLPGEQAAFQALSALLWFHDEEPARAFAELDTALSELPLDGSATPEAAARLYGQRAYLSFRLGCYDEGLADSEAALAALAVVGDAVAAAGSIEARIRSNRGLAHMYAGHYLEAKEDLERALSLHRGAAERLKAAQVLDNLGCLAALVADFPTALGHFDEALAEHRLLGQLGEHVVVDRAELLMAARLYPEARVALVEAVEVLEKGGLSADAAEARLHLAEACLRAGDEEAAREAADGARDAFERQERTSWAVKAEEILARIERTRCERRGEELAVWESARRSAVLLEAAGWHVDALEARVAAGRAATRAGRPDLVLDVLGAFTAPGTGLSVSAPALERTLFAHARALGLAAMGRRRDALATVEDGLAAAEADRSGWQEDGAGRAGGLVTEELRETGLSLLVAAGNPERVLAFAESSRREAVPARTPESSLGSPPEEDLLYFLLHDGGLSAVAVDGDGARLRRLGPHRDVARAVASLRFAMSELSRPARRTSAPHAGMADLLRRSISELEDLLVLGELSPGTAPLVIVPAGALWDLPFGALRTFAEREFVLAPSLARAARPPRSRPHRRVLVVAGPDLEGAEGEAASVASSYPCAAVSLLSPGSSTVASLLEGLGRCDLAHLAVHGRFRADNPSMSSLVLSDGEVTMHELSGLEERPSCVVLSACEAGRVEVDRGSTSGPVSSLLAPAGGRGAHRVVAPVVQVADREMPPLAAALHRLLAAGHEPEAALKALRRCSSPLGEIGDEEFVRGAGRRALCLASFVVHRAALGAGVGEPKEGELCS